jgi:exonuclease VII large subunit
MSESARVHSIEAVKDWKEALCVFHTEALEAVCAVEMEIRRTFDWLQERIKHWQSEIRRRDNLVVQARNDLMRRRMMTTAAGKEPDTTEQEKALRKAQARLREAEEKLERARQLVPVLQRAVEEYEGPARRLSNILEGDLPRAFALLDRKIDALDAYVGMAPPVRSEAAPAKPNPSEGGAS